MALKQNRMRETQKKKSNPNPWLASYPQPAKRTKSKAAARINPRRITM